jgi:hypothetical protein
MQNGSKNANFIVIRGATERNQWFGKTDCCFFGNEAEGVSKP